MQLETNWNRYEQLKVRLGELKSGFDSPKGRACIERVKKAVIEDNRDGLIRGLDKNGVRMHELAPSTIEHRDGTGAPLVPKNAESRAIANFQATEGRQGNQVVVRVWWTGDTDWIRFHKRGAGHLPIRDIVGIRPAGRQRVKDIVKAFQRDLVRGSR